MANTTQCGDRRCTLEDAELQVSAYREGYTVHIERLKKADIDALDPSMTRVKTEMDEMSELLERAKKNGASAWDGMKDSVQAALDRLSANYGAAIGDRTK